MSEELMELQHKISPADDKELVGFEDCFFWDGGKRRAPEAALCDDNELTPVFIGHGFVADLDEDEAGVLR
jgi:hypothetical protein